MKDTIRDLISQAIYSMQELRKDKMTLRDRIKLESSLVKPEIAKTLLYRFIKND